MPLFLNMGEGAFCCLVGVAGGAIGTGGVFFGAALMETALVREMRHSVIRQRTMGKGG
jgi:hypothetical protein